MNYWLLKSEPDTFSYDDLSSAPNRCTVWDGVRNYQARNILRDDIKQGDFTFFYHSSCKEPAIVGICHVTRTHITDPSAFDRHSEYYDPKSDPDNPRWITIEVEALHALWPVIPLKQLRKDSALTNMALLNRARLSVQPVTAAEWHRILNLTQQQ